MFMGLEARRLVVLVLSLLLVLVSSSAAAVMEGGAAGATKQGEAVGAPKQEAAAVHIVFTRKPDGVEPQVHHVRTLTSVLGSEEAAKEALVYSYSTAASGFAAKLTPQQAEEMSKHPDVLQVQPDEVLELASGHASLGAV